jgi:DNA polymerase-1
MTNGTDKGLADVQLHLVDSVEEASNFLRWLGERRPMDGAVGLDIETGEKAGRPTKDALSPWKGDIRLVQVGDGQQGWAIPWEEWSGVFYQGMIPYEGPIVCHNIAFESKWFSKLSRYRIPWHRSHDTMIMSQVVNANEPSHALKKLTRKYIDAQATRLQDGLNQTFAENGWTWGSVPVEYQPYWAYGALDPVITMRLFEMYWKDVQPGAQYSMPYEIEMNTRRIATTMELNGARIDLEYSERKLEELQTYADNLKQWTKNQYDGASISSPTQMIRLFEGKLNAEITEFTPSGGKSLTKDQLKKFLRDDNTAEVRNLAQQITNHRKAEKLASSYFSNFLKDNIDGYVHPQINTMGARTGRMSITDPALQTLPSKDALVRTAFLPKDDTYGIISSDLDQVEFRLTANLSMDKTLIEVFHEADRTQGDVFTTIMQQVYEDDSLIKEDPRRGLIKSTVYGKLYGAGAEKMSLTAGVSVEQMQSVINAFDASYPGIKILQKNIENIGSQRLRDGGEAYVNTKTGRKLPGDDDRVYALTNYLIQASAAEIFKQNLIKLDAQDLTELLIVPVHDEIVMQAKKSEAAEVMHIVQECMTTTEGWDVPLTSGVEGPFDTWGSKYEKKKS